MYTATNAAKPKLPYLPALDGLRAFAVLAVLLYHADVAWMPGGFLGVECFFVLSGFLITSLLHAEYQQQGTIKLWRFWVRRVWRLLPALFLVLAATATFVLRFAPEEAAEFRGDLLAALTYTTNWWLIVRQQSYFAALDRPSVLQHLWSLAVEMQFYLVWPPLFLVLIRLLRRWGTQVTVVVACVMSTYIMALLFQADADPSRVYYGTDTRIAGLLIGAGLALIYQPRSVVKNRHRRALDRAFLPRSERVLGLALDGLGIATLVELVIISLRMDEFSWRLYHGGFAAVALLAAILIFAATDPRARLLPGLLGWAPFRWLGTRSYSIYLWHWPIFVFTRPQLDVPFDGAALMAVRFGLAVLLAELSYRLIERPLRYQSLRQSWQTFCSASRWRQTIYAARTLMVVCITILMTSWIGGTLAYATPQAPEAEQALASRDQGPEARGQELKSTDQASEVASQDRETGSQLSDAGEQDWEAEVQNLATEDQKPSVDVSIMSNLLPTEHAVTTPVPTITAPTTTTAVTPVREPHVLAIGDSVMVGATSELHKAIGDIEIDAKVSRQAKAALTVVQADRDAGKLGDAVVLHIGTNGPFSVERFDAMMDALKTVPRVIVVNTKVPRRWEHINNTMLAEAVARYPNVRLVDWYTASIDHPEYFRHDGIHLKPTGARRYAELIAQAVTGL